MTIETQGEFAPIDGVVSEVVKELTRRVELRHRLEAEGIVMTDEEFIAYADRTGMRI